MFIRDRFECSIYLRVAFVLLLVDLGGGIYSRAVFITVQGCIQKGGGGGGDPGISPMTCFPPSLNYSI